MADEEEVWPSRRSFGRGRRAGVGSDFGGKVERVSAVSIEYSKGRRPPSLESMPPFEKTGYSFPYIF